MLDQISDLTLSILEPQAGGGGRFGSGGGGGFSGGSGDGDGMGAIFYFLIRLAIEVPVIGVPLLIVAVVVFIKTSRKGVRTQRRRVIRRNAPAVVAGRSAQLAAEVRKTDPKFEHAAFLARVRNAFGKIQDAWCAQELAGIGHFVSDGVFERFSLQIEEQKEEGWRQGMQGLSVRPLALEHFESGAQFDTLTVRIPFAADIHRVTLSNDRVISGSQIPRNHFTEVWSFVRRRGAKSVADKGLMEGQCPNCGAALAINQAGDCDTCGAHVRSGEFDWVLTEITQASEWRAEGEQRLPGFAAYAKADPGLSVQLVEDRASLAFWRKAAADRKGSAEPLARVATEGYLRSYADLIEALPGRDRFYIAENAVGSVRTLGVLAGAKCDRAVVEIVSDGRRAEVDDKGRRKVESARHLQRALYVFEREAGRTTRLAETFTSAICQNCGAHDGGGLGSRCPYCEAPRTGDRDAWLLGEIVVDRSAAARELREELAALDRPTPDSAPAQAGPGTSSADLLTWAAALVHADGRVDGRERLALESLGERLGASPSRLEEMLAEGGDGSAVPEPRDSLEARSWMRSLLRLALGSGQVTPPEWRLLKHAASQFWLGKIEYERILRQEERELARESRRSRR